jgi:hypothetical protein
MDSGDPQAFLRTGEEQVNHAMLALPVWLHLGILHLLDANRGG